MSNVFCAWEPHINEDSHTECCMFTLHGSHTLIQIPSHFTQSFSKKIIKIPLQNFCMWVAALHTIKSITSAFISGVKRGKKKRNSNLWEVCCTQQLLWATWNLWKMCQMCMLQLIVPYSNDLKIPKNVWNVYGKNVYGKNVYGNHWEKIGQHFPSIFYILHITYFNFNQQISPTLQTNIRSIFSSSPMGMGPSSLELPNQLIQYNM